MKKYVGTSFDNPKIISTCTGMRGLERGIERAIGPVRTVAYVEIEAIIIENLVRQMEEGILGEAPIWTNIKTFPSESFHRKIHGITGGYPCQPFSHAGKRAGTEDPRHLWPYISRMVERMQIDWCFFENVPGHLTLGYDIVRADLQRLGYTVEEGIFSAEEVGAPHIRKRLFILALANGIGTREQQQQGNLTEVRGRPFDGCQTMGHARSVRSSWFSGCFPSTSGEIEGEACREYRERMRHAIESPGEAIPNPERQGLALGQEQPTQQECEAPERGGDKVGFMADTVNDGRESFGHDTGMGRQQFTEEDRWPARPGEPQFDWEHSRTIEPGMGFTIDGHNFREDILRMAGNGVVEQTAELAFRTLLHKHFSR